MPVKQAAKTSRPELTALVAIGAYKVFEGFLLVAAGIGAMRLLHRDLSEVMMHWVHVLRVDPDNRYIHLILEKVLAISPKQLRDLSVGTFVYAALRFAEGFGLVYQKRWAEYLTIISTALFIPVEIYEIVRHLTPLKIAVFAGNIFIVWFLIYGLSKKKLK